MADRERLLAWANMIVRLLEETELWDDVYIAIAAHMTLREIFSELIERGCIAEDEAWELGIHPDSIEIPGSPVVKSPSNVLPLRRV